jgi:hypothetical protein
MSAGWHVRLERELAEVERSADSGKALLYFHHQIDDLASGLGLQPLSGFFCPDKEEVVAYLRDQGVNPDDDAIPDPEWFDASDGLATVRGLLARLRDDPTSVPQGEKVISDLEDLERALVPAELHGVRFHLTRKLPMSRP